MTSKQLGSALSKIGYRLVRKGSVDGKYWGVENSSRDFNCRSLREVKSLLNALSESSNVCYDGVSWYANSND